MAEAITRQMSPAQSPWSREASGQARPSRRAEPAVSRVSGSRSGSGLSHVPYAVVEAIAGCVARRAILFPGVKRLAFIGPHHLAVVAGDERPVTHRFGVCAGH